ncbi:hypothetical protein MPRG_33060 [Mycobacterium paragordonae]|uniref:Uncharacterized protein n=1 Tax=Mycobacterium paragordonae TaxID=1389713 RepID=A0ABQ1C6T6_9MYCO|nr:hypothetical protein MPRG_33060 [Mycobacterium paragordonae]
MNRCGADSPATNTATARNNAAVSTSIDGVNAPVAYDTALDPSSTNPSKLAEAKPTCNRAKRSRRIRARSGNAGITCPPIVAPAAQSSMAPHLSNA